MKKGEVTQMEKVKVHSDSGRLEQVLCDKQRKVTALAVSKPFGRLCYALGRPQAVQWASDPMPLKMLTLYLAAKDYLIKAGIPKQLVELAANAYLNIKGKPVSSRLHRSVMFISPAWHSRAVRSFKLLVKEFEDGKNVESYGSASGIIELLALIVSENHTVKLTLLDLDPVGVDLAEKLVALFKQHGHDVSSQVTIRQGDICESMPSEETDTIVSLGLLHNYFPLDKANELMQKWLSAGVSKVITDIYYEPKDADDGKNDAKLRISFVKNVLKWKFGPPDGLHFYNKETFCKSLPGKKIDVYCHSLNATIVVTA
jgi:hypothetical protein